MILLTIFLITILQIALYFLLEKRKLGNFKFLVLISVLVGYIFIFPPMFYPKMPEGPKCGLPMMGVTLAFWVIGGLASTMAHLIYSIVITRKRKLMAKV